MKKVLAILLAIAVLALSACAAKQVNSDTQKDSNTAETEQKPGSEQTEQPAQEAKRVEPMPESLDLNALTDATVAASFGADDISETDGKTELTLTVYDYDIYDMVDIAQLAVGDTIVVDGKDMVVTSREDENGFVTINGGLEQGGVDLTSDDSGVYYAVGLDDTKSYHELGKVTVPVADGFALTDNADPEHPDETYAAADLAELAASEPGFTANNTLATIEHGELTFSVRKCPEVFCLRAFSCFAADSPAPVPGKRLDRAGGAEYNEKNPGKKGKPNERKPKAPERSPQGYPA